MATSIRDFRRGEYIKKMTEAELKHFGDSLGILFSVGSDIHGYRRYATFLANMSDVDIDKAQYPATGEE